MTKKNFKRVFSAAFVTSLAALAVSNVNALSIRENVNKEITDGTYIIGISKFTPDQVLTGVKVSKATINDMIYNNSASYAGPSIYYYDFGSWFELDEDNKYNPVSDTKIIAKLNSRDVFYVNNVEKAFDVSYNVQIPTGKKVMFKTNVENKSVVYNNGTLTIPASVDVVTAYLVDEDAEKVVAGDKVLDVIQKEKETVDAVEFNYVTSSNSTGTIAADGEYTANGDFAVNGNNVTIGGVIGWTNGTENGGYDNGAGAGHRIGVKLTCPNGTNLSTLGDIDIEYTSSLDEKDAPARTTKWAENITDKDNQFWFTPVVKEGEVITLKVKWSEDIEQVFTITVAGTLEEMPAGTLAGETLYVYDTEKNEYTTEARLTASVNRDNDVITFNGKNIDWKHDEATHTTNKVTVMVTPDEYYSSQKDFKLSSVAVAGTHKIYDDTEEKWVDEDVDLGIVESSVVDGKIVIDVALSEDIATEKNRTVTVHLTWDEGYTQSFDVVLGDSTPFVYPSVKLVNASVKTNKTEKTYSPETDNEDRPTNTVIVKGFIDWDTTKGGNPVKVKLNTSAFSDEEVKNLSLRVNGNVLTTTVDGKEVNLPVTKAADYTFDFIAEQKPYTVELLWNGERVVDTYTVNVTASLEEAPEGSIVYKTTGADDKVTAVYSRSSKTLTVYTNGENVKVPYVYSLASTAINVALENSNYSNVADKVEVTLDGNTYEAKLVDGGYAVKVQAGKTTTVKVTWDALNTQTFKVVAEADAEFATAEAGKAVYAADAASADFSAEGVSTTLTIPTGAVANWNNGYTLEKKVFLKPADSKLTAIGEGAYMTITGGAYDNYRVEYKTLDSMFDKANKVLPLAIRTNNANDTVTVTICWGESYVETYKINIVDANLKASTYAQDVEMFVAGNDTAVLTASKDYRNSNLVYAGTIAYADGYHSLTAEIDNTNISKLTVSDAKSAADGKDKVYESGSVPTEFGLHFTNAKRKATVTIEYTDGYVQTIVVDGTNAKLPTINLSSNLEKDENGDYVIENGKYKYTAKVGDKIYLYNSTSPLGLDVNVSIDGVNSALDGKNAVLENVGTGTITAKAVGVTVVKLELDGTDPILVEVSVLPEQAVKISNAQYVIDDTNEDNVTATITANVTGGYYSSYNVRVAIQELVAGKYTPIVANKTVAAVNDNGVWTATFDNIDPEAKYKFTIIAANSYYEAMNENEAFADTASLETTPTAYTVKLNNTYGDITLVSNIVPGSTIELPAVADIKRPNATKEGIEYTYTFAGWYKASDVDANGIAKANTSAVIATDAPTLEVSASMDLVAAWTEAKAQYKVKFVYANVTEETTVESGAVITKPKDTAWYIDNAENFDSEGKLTNNAKAYDFTTKATGDITLKTEASKN